MDNVLSELVFKQSFICGKRFSLFWSSSNGLGVVFFFVCVFCFVSVSSIGTGQWGWYRTHFLERDKLFLHSAHAHPHNVCDLDSCILRQMKPPATVVGAVRGGGFSIDDK